MSLTRGSDTHAMHLLMAESVLLYFSHMEPSQDVRGHNCILTILNGTQKLGFSTLFDHDPQEESDNMIWHMARE